MLELAQVEIKGYGEQGSCQNTTWRAIDETDRFVPWWTLQWRIVVVSTQLDNDTWEDFPV